MKNPIIVALDLDSPKKAMDLAVQLESVVGGFKVGPRLTHRAPPDFIQDLSRLGLVFFDHKFFDIPSTTTAAVQAAAEAGATWATVHALNGPKTLKELATLELKIRKNSPDFRVVAVTVLTSFDPAGLPPIWQKGLSIADSVEKLAFSAYEQGLRTFVCSPEEVPLLKKKLGPGIFVIVPGIRPVGSDSKDQNRVATPQEAIKNGADALVIGRPIIEAQNPVRAAQDILAELQR